MIKLEIFEQDGRLIVDSKWRKAEAKQMAAYRMRWLSPSARRSGRWIRVTDADGRVRTYGDVPEGQEAKPGRYGVFEVQADGSLAAEPVKTFGTSFARADRYYLDHRLGGGPELAVRWVEDQPEPKTEAPQCQAETADHACVLDDDGHTEHRDGPFTETEPEPTEDQAEVAMGQRVSGWTHGQHFTGAISSCAIKDGALYVVTVTTDQPVTTPAGRKVSKVYLRGADRIVTLKPEPATWGKTLGEMAPAERAAVIKRAAAQMQAELQANAGAIGKVMDEAEVEPSKVTRELTGISADVLNAEVTGAFIRPAPPAYLIDGVEVGSLVYYRSTLTHAVAGVGDSARVWKLTPRREWHEVTEPQPERPAFDQAAWLAGEYEKASAANLAANRAAEAKRQELDQAQHDVNRLYITGEMTRDEWKTALAAITAKRDITEVTSREADDDGPVYIEMNAEPPHPPRTLADYERQADEAEREA